MGVLPRTPAQILWYNRYMTQATLDQFATLIAQAKPAEQRRFLKRLPYLLKISAADLALLKLAEDSFDFWDNTEDAIYDRL